MRKKMRSTRAVKRFWILLFGALFLLPGCSFTNLKEDIKEQQSLAVIEGRVSLENFSTPAPIIVGLISTDALHPTLVNHRLLSKPGSFLFKVPPGQYRTFAFIDANNDQKYQGSERISNVVSLEIGEAGIAYQARIFIKNRTVVGLQQEAKDLQTQIRVEKHTRRVVPGTQIDLDADIFSVENINMGLWQPLNFVKSIEYGLFFLEKYDPEKVPVLFVHGVSGSPAQFREIIDSLDKNVYQPFVLYYPSGFPISMVGESLKLEVEEAQVRYGFTEMNIIAHSMGGLVTRSFINEIASSGANYRIPAYITISTPWGGHDAASMGLQYAPAIIPVWNDIAPGSAFLEDIDMTGLPDDTDHYLLFGYQGSSRFAGGNSDGVVSIASQLRMSLQEQATLIRGYNETHTSILKNENLHSLINIILAKHAKKQ
jgi:pimeloyl-ACP methyl ester carboxylesterase